MSTLDVARCLALACTSFFGCAGAPTADGALEPGGDPVPREGAVAPIAAPADAPLVMAPTPYTFEQIRDASRAGREWVWRLESPGDPIVARRIRFTQVRAEDVSFEVTMLDAAMLQDAGPPETATATWEELRDHASFAERLTTISSEHLDVPAGSFDCVVYRVRDGAAGQARVFYFARELPGPPVLSFSERSGARTEVSTLMRYMPGGDLPTGRAARANTCSSTVDCVLDSVMTSCDPCMCPRVYARPRTGASRSAPRPCRAGSHTTCRTAGACGGAALVDNFTPVCRNGACVAEPRSEVTPT